MPGRIYPASDLPGLFKQEEFMMQADYRNWMPKGMAASFIGAAAGSWTAAGALHSLMPEGKGKKVQIGRAHV